MNSQRTARVFLAATALAGCGEEDEGSLRVQLSADQTVVEGLSVGAGPEQARDCSVTYSKYVVAVGHVQVGNTARKASLRDDSIYVADLKQIGEQSVDLIKFDDLAAGQWDQVEYQTPAATAAAKPVGGVSAGDLQEMVSKGLTYWIEGEATCSDKRVGFSFQVATPTRYSACESDGEPGVSVGGASTMTITLHADHLFFDSLPTGSEGAVSRRAGWLVRADRNGDGRVVTDELAAAPAEQVFPSAEYNLAGGPPIATALDFVRAQLGTQGHIDGEGECVWTTP